MSTSKFGKIIEQQSNIQENTDAKSCADGQGAHVCNRKHKEQSEVTPEELKERQDNLNTRGRKGCKSPRINLAFTPTNHEFVKTMGRYYGGMARFLNMMIDYYREQHAEQYEAILAAEAAAKAFGGMDK